MHSCMQHAGVWYLIKFSTVCALHEYDDCRLRCGLVGVIHVVSHLCYSVHLIAAASQDTCMHLVVEHAVQLH